MQGAKLKIVKPDPNEIAEKNEDNPLVFWYSELSGSKLKWKIDNLKLINFARNEGYKRFDIVKDFIFTLIVDRVIDEVTITQIQDFVIEYINTIDEDVLYKSGIERRQELLSKFYSSPGFYFNRTKLSLLGAEPNLKLNSDSKEKCFIYYTNGFVECSSEGFKLKKYKHLEGYIFKNQIKGRNFKNHSSDGMFQKFVLNICNGNESRFLSLQTMIGYLLHGFYETKMKAVNLTDSTISDVAEGRTGKTLLGRAISQIKNVCEISGKDFDPANKHKYSAASLDTQIVFLNDLRKNFNFEHLFNDISDAITVDRKNLQPFTIRAKIMIAANDTFRVEGASAKDRVIEFELSDHYNADYSPADEFDCWFFTDWDENEWLSFDNFMMKCISIYLKDGVIEAKSINLEQRKKIQHTNSDFVEFMDDKIKEGKIKLGGEYNKTDLHHEFLEQFPEYKEHRWLKRTANFTRYLKTYASYSEELNGKVEERRTDGKSLIKFLRKESHQSKLPF